MHAQHVHNAFSVARALRVLSIVAKRNGGVDEDPPPGRPTAPSEEMPEVNPRRTAASLRSPTRARAQLVSAVAEGPREPPGDVGPYLLHLLRNCERCPSRAASASGTRVVRERALMHLALRQPRARSSPLRLFTSVLEDDCLDRDTFIGGFVKIEAGCSFSRFPSPVHGSLQLRRHSTTTEIVYELVSSA